MNFSTALITLGYYLLGIGGICFLIGFHELGHFLMCKLFSVKTPSFSIGFGPKLFSKKIGETEFSFSAIPLGGYVEIAGIEEVGQGEQKDAHRSDSYAFNQKPYYQKTLILLGGIIFNMFFTYAVFVFLLGTQGIPQSTIMCTTTASTTIQNIIPTGAAFGVLQQGDTLVTVNNTNVLNNPSIVAEALALSPEKAELLITRNNQEEHITIPFAPQQKKILGLQFATKAIPATSLTTAFGQAYYLTIDIFKQTCSLFGSMFKRKSIEGLGGPIRIIKDTMDSARSGMSIYLIALALISLNLAVLNLIPLPILDGGQIVFTTIEALIRRPLPSKLRIAIHIGCWLLMLGLFIYLSIFDIIDVVKSLFA